MGEALKVVPADQLSVIITPVLAIDFLYEEFTTKSLAGYALIGAETLLMVLWGRRELGFLVIINRIPERI